MKRALILAATAVILFNLWRFMPPGALPFIAYAWGIVGIGIALQRLAPYPDEALPFLWLPAVAASAAALAADPQTARMMFGFGLVALAVIAVRAATDWPMRAFAAGIATEPVMWFAANVAPKLYGPEIATSAFGQAFGAWGAPAQWAVIVALYAFAWYNQEANKDA